MQIERVLTRIACPESAVQWYSPDWLVKWQHRCGTRWKWDGSLGALVSEKRHSMVVLGPEQGAIKSSRGRDFSRGRDLTCLCGKVRVQYIESRDAGLVRFEEDYRIGMNDDEAAEQARREYEAGVEREGKGRFEWSTLDDTPPWTTTARRRVFKAFPVVGSFTSPELRVALCFCGHSRAGHGLSYLVGSAGPDRAIGYGACMWRDLEKAVRCMCQQYNPGDRLAVGTGSGLGNDTDDPGRSFEVIEGPRVARSTKRWVSSDEYEETDPCGCIRAYRPGQSVRITRSCTGGHGEPLILTVAGRAKLALDEEV